MTNPPGHNVRRLLRGIVLACLLTSGQQLAFPAETQFLLRNGDRITGRILAEDTTRVTLTNDVLGTVSIPLARINKRLLIAPESPSAVPPLDRAAQRQLDDARAAYVTGQISSAEYHRQRAKILAQSSLAQPAAIAAVPLTPAGSAPAPAAAPGQKPAMKFTGEIQAGMDLALATKDRQLYTGRLKLQHSYDRLRNNADYLFTYGRTEDELTANRMDGTVKNDYDLTTEVYAYHQGNAGYDEVRKLDNYWQVGPGGGWHAIKGTNLTFNLEAGVNFQEQNRTDGTDTDVFYYRLAEHGKWVLNHRFTLDQKLEFFPQWDDFSEYKLRFETTLKLALNGHLSLNLTLIDLYDTMSAQGVEPNDLQIRSTIGVRF